MNLTTETLTRDTRETNSLAWFRERPLNTYGYITKIIDDCVVEVCPVVQRSEERKQKFTVTLLSISSNLFELKIKPKVNDLVLMWSLNKYDAAMFDDISTREAGKEVIIHPEDTGYTIFTMVGILAKTYKAASAVNLEIAEDGEKAEASFDFDALTEFSFGKDAVLTLQSSDGTAYKAVVSVDEFHPITAQINSPLTSDTGITDVADGKKKELPAPITKTVHGSSPVSLDIRSPVTLRVGIGNAESDSADEPRDAPVSVTLGENSDLSVTSDAGLTLAFKKAVSIAVEETIELMSKSGTIKLGNDTATLKALLDEYNDILSAFDTVGSPAQHMTGPGAKSKLAALKSKQGQVFA